MKRLPIAAVLILMACGDLDHGPSGPGSNDYYPFEVGNSWTFTRFGTGTTHGQPYTLTGSRTVLVRRSLTHSSGFPLVEVRTFGSDTTVVDTTVTVVDIDETEYISETEEAITAYADSAAPEALWTIPIPLYVGNTWQYSTGPQPVSGKVISLNASITVPAGFFGNLMILEMTWSDSLSTGTMDMYFAPGVGLVADELTVEDDSLGVTDQVSSQLSEYTVQ
jgi:hypothetical protein